MNYENYLHLGDCLEVLRNFVKIDLL